VGLAIYATQTKRVTDEMFIEAAHALADQVTAEQLQQGLLYPPQADILETEIKVAARVAKVVFDSNLARVATPADYEAFIRSHVYTATYRDLV
jgi:malate dehydrogenase (oxaloacetate-decarboxylating)(NADP+)